MKKLKHYLIRVLSCVLSLVLISLIVPSGIFASAATVRKRALVISAPYDNKAISSATVDGMYNMFVSQGITTTKYVNNAATNSSVFSKIDSVLGNASSTDISYIFIQCHGTSTGQLAINGKGKTLMTLSALKTALDKISGQKILMLNTCYAGNAISKSVNSADENVSYAQLMINQFIYGNDEIPIVPNSGEFNGDTDYVVFCSSMKDEESYSYTNSYAFAAYAWALGAGYSMDYNAATNLYADKNKDQIITVKEYYDYSKQKVLSMCSSGHEQTICYYSFSDYYSIFYSDYPLGDINQDRAITAADVMLVRQHVAEIITLTGRQFQLADMSGDGKVDAQDTLLIRRYVAEM